MSKTGKKDHKKESKIRMDLPIYEGEGFDKSLHASLSKIWGWLSPAASSLAFFDWFVHFGMSPAKIVTLSNEIREKLWIYYLNLLVDPKSSLYKPCIECKQDDHRFKSELWHAFPFNAYSQGFLLLEQFLNEATSNVRGVNKHHEEVVNFLSRQILDLFSPSNFPLTNPEVLKVTLEKNGMNFVQGFQNFIEDFYRVLNKLPPVGTDDFKIGENVAITPGKVIYRNRLIELIQYEPKTKSVYEEPILIIPAWIMKYYILDLSPHNSLVKYLVKRGHTVFMISWKNPTKEDRNLSLEDYMKDGILSSLEVIEKIIPQAKIHTVGYCIGGTLLMITASYLAGKGDERLNSVTTFATQIDFKEAGELSLFIDDSQITYLEDIMWENGYLDGNQMSGAFSLLRSSELIWSRIIKDYLIGERQALFDIMAWDYDTTRLPYRMHSEYLRKLFLNNQLVQGQLSIAGKQVALGDINIPIFVVSTVKDHVAPWKSVYKVHLFCKTEITFVLTSGGHNAGILSEPGHPDRHYQMMTKNRTDKYLTADSWQDRAPIFDGSWWESWHQWLAEHSSERGSLPPMGNPSKEIYIITEAPGTYVHQK